VRLALQQPLPARAVGDEQPHGVRRHPVDRWIPPDAAPPRSLLVLGLRHRPQVHREREGERWEEAEGDTATLGKEIGDLRGRLRFMRPPVSPLARSPAVEEGETPIN
jgi:hypothetical protein